VCWWGVVNLHESPKDWSALTSVSLRHRGRLGAAPVLRCSGAAAPGRAYALLDAALATEPPSPGVSSRPQLHRDSGHFPATRRSSCHDSIRSCCASLTCALIGLRLAGESPTCNLYRSLGLSARFPRYPRRHYARLRASLAACRLSLFPFCDVANERSPRAIVLVTQSRHALHLRSLLRAHLDNRKDVADGDPLIENKLDSDNHCTIYIYIYIYIYMHTYIRTLTTPINTPL
jgi:hypothetical protein